MPSQLLVIEKEKLKLLQKKVDGPKASDGVAYSVILPPYLCWMEIQKIVFFILKMMHPQNNLIWIQFLIHFIQNIVKSTFVCTWKTFLETGLNSYIKY